MSNAQAFAAAPTSGERAVPVVAAVMPTSAYPDLSPPATHVPLTAYATTGMERKDSTSTGSTSGLPPCKYGSSCTRKNPDHWARYSHPGAAPPGCMENASNRDSCRTNQTMESPKADLPPCQFWANCNVSTPDHWSKFSHPFPAPRLTIDDVAVQGVLLSLEDSTKYLSVHDTPVDTIARIASGDLLAASVWQWMDDHQQWRGFPLATGSECEASYKAFKEKDGAPEVTLGANTRFTYRINFIDMQQVNVATGKIRKIRRVDVSGEKQNNAGTTGISHRDIVIAEQVAAINEAYAELKTLSKEERESGLRRMRARFHPDNKDPSLRWLFEALAKHVNNLQCNP